MDELKRLFLDSLPSRIEALEAANQVFLDQKSNSLDSIRRIAHMLKGIGGTCGFPEVSELAARLEDAPEEEVKDRLDGLLNLLKEISNNGGTTERGILVIEDEPDIGNLLKIIISGKNRKVHLAESTAAAEKILAEKEIHLILLDLILPDADGRNLLVRLREKLPTANIPVFILSSHMNKQTQSECIALGANACFSKPFDRLVVTSAVTAELQRIPNHAREISVDALTGLPKRSAFFERYLKAQAQLEREGQVFTLASIDIDFTRSISERFGDLTCDEAIRRVAQILSNSLRRDDFLVHWSRTEFIALFPNSNSKTAYLLLETAMQTLRKETLLCGVGRGVQVTFSAGVADILESQSAEEAISKANHYLFLAKELGRNRILSNHDSVQVARKHILLAEDDELVASVVKHRLDRVGLDVYHYPEGDQVYQAARTQIFHLVILDVKIPVMDGFELLCSIRNLSGYKDVPIVMLTSMGSQKDIIRGFELGANDYILKPFSPLELVARVQRLLKK